MGKGSWEAAVSGFFTIIRRLISDNYFFRPIASINNVTEFLQLYRERLKGFASMKNKLPFQHRQDP